MHRRLSLLTALVPLVAVLAGCGRPAVDSAEASKAPPKPAAEKPTLVINLTSGEDDLHAVMMGLHLAEHGVAAERQTVVFFNVKAPPLARKELADTVRLGDMMPVGEMIAKLQKDGVTMLVCPMCAEVMGVEADQLAEGIKMIEDRMQLFDHLHAGATVFTY